MAREKLYASFDVEVDGPIPLKHSMISIGIVFFDSNGDEIQSYQRNIKPVANKIQDPKVMTDFWSKFPDVWQFITSNQVEPAVFVMELSKILKLLGRTYDMVWVAHPAAFDWQWLKNYYEFFRAEDMPELGYTARCGSTLFWAYCKQNKIEKKEQDALRERLCEGLKHTHNPNDDAREQGKMFINLCKLMNISLS
ncbi:MAG: exonuclease [Hyperionvirus sp.]|uniref:Exonuclease n=1 Tax=Hyperionvirus sp. TaxID=2487770 RepID=A0A3G5AB78_9VIRU|nr:MAG: exonuclease [Hyperionvirus sp.]